VFCISPRDKLIVSVGNAMFSCFWSAGIMAGVPCTASSMIAVSGAPSYRAAGQHMPYGCVAS
jgi:hypothetical protein